MTRLWTILLLFGALRAAAQTQIDHPTGVPVYLYTEPEGIHVMGPSIDTTIGDAWGLDDILTRNEGILERRYPFVQAGPINIVLDRAPFERTKPVEYILGKHGYSYGIMVMIRDQPISSILVNGKRFFEDDPCVGTRNLPPDVIGKVQVIDTL
jgi:hypothetical protein